MQPHTVARSCVSPRKQSIAGVRVSLPHAVCGCTCVCVCVGRGRTCEWKNCHLIAKANVIAHNLHAASEDFRRFRRNRKDGNIFFCVYMCMCLCGQLVEKIPRCFVRMQTFKCTDTLTYIQTKYIQTNGSMYVCMCNRGTCTSTRVPFPNQFGRNDSGKANIKLRKFFEFVCKQVLYRKSVARNYSNQCVCKRILKIRNSQRVLRCPRIIHFESLAAFD